MVRCYNLLRIAFLILACLSPGARGQLPCSSEDPLERFLQSIHVGPLPPICLNISWGDPICLSDLTIFSIDIEGVPSSYVPPTGYLLGIDGMTAACSGKWQMGAATGTLTGTLLDFSSNIGVDFVKSIEGVLAAEVAMQWCNVSQLEVDVIFSGDDRVIVNLLNSMSSSIEDIFERAVSAVLCGPIAKRIIADMTLIIQNTVNPKLTELMSFGPSTPPELPDCVNWHETPLETIHVLADLLHTNGEEIVDCLSTACSSTALKKKNDLFEVVFDHFFPPIKEVSIPIDILVELAANASLYLDTVTIYGLRSINDVTILSPISTSNVTLSTSLRMGFLNITISGVFSLPDYTEAVAISTRIENVSLLVDLVLGISSSELNDLYLDQLAHMGCLQQLVKALSISSLIADIKVEQLKYVQIAGCAGPLEEDVAAIIQNFIYLLIDGYPELVHAVITGIGQGPFRLMLNERLSEHLDKINQTSYCPPHTNYDPDDSEWINWNTSVVIKTLDLFLDTVMGAEGLNRFFSCATGGTGVVRFTPRPEMIITLSGLTSFYDFSVLLPVVYEPYELYNAIGLGYCPSDASTGVCTPFEIDIQFNIEKDPGDIAVSFQNVQIMLGLFLEVDLHEVYNLQFSNWTQSGCKLSTVDDIHLYDMKMSSSFTEIFVEGGNGHRNITRLMNNLFARLTSMSNIAKINSNLNSYVESSEYVCAESSDPSKVTENDDPGDEFSWRVYAYVGGVIAATLMLLFSHYMYSYKDSKSLWRVLLSGGNVFKAMCPQLYEEYGFDEALIFHEDLHLFWRLMLPIGVIGLFALFFSSNVSMAVDVYLEIDIGTEVFKLPPIFSFGLGNTIQDMWDAEVYALSALVAFFSGAWPYVKLVVMLVCWVLPPRLVKLSLREKLLEWIDILGKWSILDAYVMTMLMVAFHIKVTLEEPVTAIVTVLPLYGFYSFVAATMGSLVIGHFALGAHNFVVGERRAINESLLAWGNHPAMSHEFLVPERGSRIDITCWGKISVILLIFLTALLIIAAGFMQTFVFKMRGLIGWMMDLTDSADTNYSMVDVGLELPAASGEKSDPGVRWIQASFFAFALIMPLCLQAILLVLWSFPLSLKWQQRIFVVAEIFNAWSAIDVFAVSIVAVLLEIHDFAAFIVGDSCDNINEILAEYFDEELHGDDKCFDVVAELLPASWVIYAAAFFMTVIELPIIMICKRIMAERLERNGILINRHHKNNDNETPSGLIIDEGDSSIYTPLLADAEIDDVDNKAVLIGGSSCDSDGNASVGKWPTVVVDSDKEKLDTNSDSANIMHNDIINMFTSEISKMPTVSLGQRSGADTAKKSRSEVVGHNQNRIAGDGGSASSEESREVLSSIDLTDVPGYCISPDGRLNNVQTTERNINSEDKSKDMRRSGLSFSSSITSYEHSRTWTDSVIDLMIVLRLISEEPI